VENGYGYVVQTSSKLSTGYCYAVSSKAKVQQ